SDGWGAWEIALRYSDLDLGDAAIQGGRLKDFTAGLNWYLNPNLRWMLNYVHADLSERADVNDGNADIIETRMSLTF
ncbi:MAG TPA: porin, partial [Desulfobulbus sp.]|nr:porin [Desulfobulbus sp.]